MNAKVLGVVGDAGGAKNVAPVFLGLRGAGIQVKVYADPAGKGGGELKKRGLEFTATAEFPHDLTGVQLVLTDTSAKTQALHVNAARAVQDWRARGHQVNLVGAEDYTLTGAVRAMREMPWDVLVVADEFVQEQHRKLRPRLVTIGLGTPALDDLPALIARRNEIRRQIRQDFGIQDDEVLIILWNSDSSQINVIESLVPVLYALAGVHRVVLISEFHFADPLRKAWGVFVQEVWRSKTAKVETPSRVLPLFDVHDPDVLTLGCDIAVGQYSTSLDIAAYAIPTIYLATPSVEVYLAQRGASRPYFAATRAGAAKVVYNPSEIEGELRQCLSMRNQMEGDRERGYQPDGGATARVVEFIKTLCI